MGNRRKVFISFLGTNNYLQSYYVSSGFRSQPTRFIQQALIELQCADWTEEDQIYIFCTNDAAKYNWADNGQERKRPGESAESYGLEGILSRWRESQNQPLVPGADMRKFQLLPKFENVNIEEGFSKEDIWAIFNKVYTALKENDEIYFDITHAFRSIPMLASVLFDYAKLTKNVTVKSVHYGAFEKLGPVFEVQKRPLEDRVAPIIDMMEMLQLQQDVQMAFGVTRYGRLNLLAENLCKEEGLVKVGEEIKSLDQAIMANQGNVLREGRFMTSLQQNKKAVNRSNLSIPSKEILRVVADGLSEFRSKGEYENICAAANWAIKHRMVAQAYTYGKEYINRLSSKKLDALNPYSGEDSTIPKSTRFLMFVNAVLCMKEEDVQSRNYQSDLFEYSQCTDAILSLDWIQRLRADFPTFNNYRNQIDHCKLDEKTSFDILVSFFEEKFRTMSSIVRDAPKCKKQSEGL